MNDRPDNETVAAAIADGIDAAGIAAAGRDDEPTPDPGERELLEDTETPLSPEDGEQPDQAVFR